MKTEALITEVKQSISNLQVIEELHDVLRLVDKRKLPAAYKAIEANIEHISDFAGIDAISTLNNVLAVLKETQDD